MPDRAFAIVFRNPDPKRRAIRNELHLLRRDGSSLHIHYSDQDDCQAGEGKARATGFRRFTEFFK